MKASNAQWRPLLLDRMDPELSAEIDVFETEIELRKQGKLDEKLFAETRLRRGVYGQRYDNGQRWDGLVTQQLPYPSGGLTKGPSTVWDAPGMLRIKIPFGGLDARQLEVLAELAEEYADGIAHVTTRQDFQLHFIHIDDAPAIMRRLAAVGITTREACGNVVRNVTACPVAGVCATETFDVTPYAHALARFLLGHPDTQDFGRKFKVAFSGCADQGCGLVNMHDMGAIAKTRLLPGGHGQLERGFALYVGGGLGSVPHQAKLFDPFVPATELLPLAQAIARVFARLGEKKNRNRARIKFLVAQLGIDEFRRLVLAEREILPPDPEWTAFTSDLHAFDEQPLHPPAELPSAPANTPLAAWQRTNVQPQRHPGYYTAALSLPLGDLTPDQLRGLADLVRRYTRETLRTTVEQNILLRWVSGADVPVLFAQLQALGLDRPGAGTILDVTTCPGTDTCKLGIASSRGLAAELSTRLAENAHNLDAAVQGLHIKISGCFNSCGQHHVADFGFYGVSRHAGDFIVPHFQVVLGGQWQGNAAAYGLAVGAVPAKRIPDAVDRLTRRYVAERLPAETFQQFVKRIGKVEIRKLLDDLTQVPAYDADPAYYADWGDTRVFTIGDMGVGECAGEVITRIEFELAAAERQVFEAQVVFEQGDAQRAGELAYAAMLTGARALVKEEFYDVPADPERVVSEFRARFYDTRIFWDPYAHGKFGQYLFQAHDYARAGGAFTPELAHQRIEEAQLVLEATHAAYRKLRAARLAARVNTR
jgi:sulfite reductase (ferredoxin)